MEYENELVTGNGVDLTGKCAHIIKSGRRKGEWCGIRSVGCGHPFYCSSHQPRIYLPETDVEVFDTTGKPTGCLHTIRGGKRVGQWCGALPEQLEGLFCSRHVTPDKYLLINPELGALLPIETQMKFYATVGVFTGPFMNYLKCAGYTPEF